LPPPKPFKIKPGKGNEESIYMNKTWVEEAISERKPLFALFMVERNTSEVVKHLNPLDQSFLREFEEIFPNDLPLELPSLRVIEHQIDLLPGVPLPKKSACRCNPNESKELQ